MGRARAVFETVTTALMAIVALFVGTTYILASTRELRNRPEPFVDEWRAVNEGGIRRGAPDAALVITEFMDFQCPFCAETVHALDSMLAMYPEDVALVFQHFPLPIHEEALSSAVAAECAEQQGRFWEMHKALFERQSEIGDKDWVEFSILAGVPDTTTFRSCVSRPDSEFPRIASGLDVAIRTRAPGTPTIWMNGHVFPRGERSVRALRAFADSIGVGLGQVEKNN